MNQLLLSGTLVVPAPELRYSAKGTAVCKFTVESRSKGQREDVFEGRLDCFGPTAEYVAGLALGTPVIVVGKLTTNRYKDKAYTNLVALTVVGAIPQKVSPVQAAAPAPVAPLTPSVGPPEDDGSDVPF